jgi:hypothetical protein
VPETVKVKFVGNLAAIRPSGTKRFTGGTRKFTAYLLFERSLEMKKRQGQNFREARGCQ